MDKGAEIYKSIIDELAEMSLSCADERNVKKGKIKGVDAEKSGINKILDKLDSKEKNILAEFVLDVYHSGIFDTLDKLEWLACCRDMVITIEGETLPLGQYEGIANDYIGRRSDWEWPDE